VYKWHYVWMCTKASFNKQHKNMWETTLL